ncbi:hypothetical protein SCJ53_03915, partial [Legionella pneumophila serogroup 1]
HCERSEAIQYRILTKYRSGLLHFVRNDSIYLICFSRDGITCERLRSFGLIYPLPSGCGSDLISTVDANPSRDRKEADNTLANTH